MGGKTLPIIKKTHEANKLTFFLFETNEREGKGGKSIPEKEKKAVPKEVTASSGKNSQRKKKKTRKGRKR